MFRGKATCGLPRKYLMMEDSAHILGSDNGQALPRTGFVVSIYEDDMLPFLIINPKSLLSLNVFNICLYQNLVGALPIH